jgi:hypothetical protein
VQAESRKVARESHADVKTVQIALKEQARRLEDIRTRQSKQYAELEREIRSVHAEIHDRLLQYHLQLGRLTSLLEGRTTEPQFYSAAIPFAVETPPQSKPAPPAAGEWLELSQCQGCGTVERTIVCKWNKSILADQEAVVDTSLRFIMLSQLGRRIADFLDAAAGIGAIRRLELYDNAGRRYWTTEHPSPPPEVALALAPARKGGRAGFAARRLVGELARVRRRAEAVEVEAEVLPRVDVDDVLLVDRTEAHRVDRDEDRADVIAFLNAHSDPPRPLPAAPAATAAGEGPGNGPQKAEKEPVLTEQQAGTNPKNVGGEGAPKVAGPASGATRKP